MKAKASTFLLWSFTFPLFAQTSTDWTDWNYSNNTDLAQGTLLVDGATLVTVTASGCIAGTVINGTSTTFSDTSLFSPAIPLGDDLVTDHIGSLGQFIITFSSPVTNPIFHMADRHAVFTATDVVSGNPIEFEIASGNLGYGNATHTSLIRNDWTFPMLTASNSNSNGTTADGTFYMLGTFTQINFNLVPEDIIHFQIGDNSFVPEPSSTLLLGASSLLGLLIRRR